MIKHRKYTYNGAARLRAMAQGIILLMRKRWRGSPMEIMNNAVSELSLGEDEEKMLISLINNGLRNGGEVMGD